MTLPVGGHRWRLRLGLGVDRRSLRKVIVQKLNGGGGGGGGGEIENKRNGMKICGPDKLETPACDYAAYFSLCRC